MKEFIRGIVVFLLTLEAKAVLKKYKPKVIVVTGSVGKTSSKDAVYSALKKHTFVRKSEKSFNSDIGVPLTILGVPNGWGNLVQWFRNLLDGLLLLLVLTPYPRWLVVEVGADRPGDISRSLSWLNPSIVVATRFPDIPVHVEFYASPRHVLEEELFPLAHLKEGGTAVINQDDENTQTVSLPEHVIKISYGFSKDADIRASHYRVLTKNGAPSGISFSINYKEEKIHCSLYGVIGHVHVYAILAGVAGALAAGISFSELHDIASIHELSPGRLRLLEGIKGTTLIDDSYNASPVATEEALKSLRDAPTEEGRKIAVFGDMLELGSFSVDEHKRIGGLIPQYADMLVTVGVRARYFAEGAEHAGMPATAIHSYEKGSDATSFLLSEIKKGDVVVIKGSQSIRLERVTKALLKTPEKAHELLARQDAEWLAR